jgi:hypothetical protein
MVGTFKKNDHYSVGNPTFFNLPKSYENHSHVEDSFFASSDPSIMMNHSKSKKNANQSDDFVQ